MNQTTAYSPHYVVKLLDDRLARFARSDGDHWATICEEIKAPKTARLLAELDASADIKPVTRLQVLEDIHDLEISYGEASQLCRTSPKWIKRHLSLAYIEAGGKEDEIAGVLKLIPFTTQQGIAHEIAAVPVIKNAELGTEENPLAVGLDFAVVKAEAERLAAEQAKKNASTGPTSSPPSGGDTPASTPAS